ncbi:MAG: septal ring-binding cell division protein DamX [Candidatus Azotimanducaceae bacterium]|jgi:septal ring-binding cell division protein DamX
MKLRFVFTVLISMTLLSSCSTVNKTFDSLGGFFTKKGDKCEGPDCAAPSLIDNDQTAKKWHCYGQQDSADWQCQTSPDQSKIASIQPQQAKPRPTEPNQSNTQVAKTATPATQGSIQNNTDDSMTMESNFADEEDSSLLTQPENYFTIQLIALPEQSEIMAYAIANGITSPITARINSQGIPWYVLLLGIYPNQQTAEQAKSDWVGTRTLQTQPWVRKLGPLQAAMREAATDS